MVAEDERQRAVSNENINPHESAAFKAFQRRNGPLDGHKREGCFKLIGYPEWWPGKKGEKTKGKATCVETETSPIPGLTNEDYQYFLKHFSGTGNSSPQDGLCLCRQCVRAVRLGGARRKKRRTLNKKKRSRSTMADCLAAQAEDMAAQKL
ncbi:hypothetical protein Tco_0824664 [Tanacetum coccineum]|uniref:Uncharacterized protein n=1 Tax=Tanacetum coccineum TaxID=301880 RepID=A0ABQ5ALG7_9ASTR